MIVDVIHKNHNSNGCYFDFVYGFILAMVFCFAISGCHPVKVPEKVPEKMQSETNDLTAGETAFFQKNYNSADTLFNLIMEKSQDPNIKNIALYNLACTRLLTFQNEHEFIEAKKLLNMWHPLTEKGLHSENPLFLIQAFENILGVKEKERLESLKKNEDMDIIVKHQNKKILKMELMIKTLQHQILELENIDQEIEEKRKTN
ncbi:MAG: hypothetical protein KKE44_25140 [Proteobacteria bacterium]|nr:hypothetical protein [Pseudomonadota bacterium]MBU1586017.1 hypothetical protein [Pseudomonadota bacterium]MBU2628877.1 hypothetical protein [Pseudomonadota bacterium]